MDDLQRVEKCLHQLQDAPSASTRALSYADFLQSLQKLKNDVKDELNHARAFVYEARQLKESMRREIPNILKLCHENPLSALLGGQTEPAVAMYSGTPSLGTPRPGQRRVLINPEVRITTPRRKTPLSMSKLLLQNKFTARCSPAAFSKAQSRRTPLTSAQTAPECTPQMPSRRRPIETPNKTQTVSVPASKKSIEKLGSTAKLSEPPSCQLTAPDTTPEMTERVSFFMNPNVGNIHKRYVAIQDQDADESTCLLSTKFAPKPSRTPELPESGQKKPQTPHQKSCSTPPLPFSSTKKVQFAKSTPEMEPNSLKKNKANRTPSPPRHTASRARLCLDAELESLVVAPQADRPTKKLVSASKLSAPKRTPDLPQGRESRAPGVAITKMKTLSNRIEPLTLSKALLETPSSKTKAPIGIGTNPSQSSVLRDNMNSLRKKRLLAALERTPGVSKTLTNKATPKSKIHVERSATMPVNMENVTVPLRPSKMLRNKTVLS